MIAYLHGALLVNCGSLEVFSARGNRLYSLPESRLFRRNTQLRSVDLSHNLMLDMSNYEFSHSLNLQRINVSSNFIMRFYPEDNVLRVKNPAALVALDLSNNRLTGLPVDLLVAMSGNQLVAVNNNLLKCSTSFLLALTPYLSSTGNHVTDRSGIRCAEPAHLADQVVGDMTCPRGARFNLCAPAEEPTCRGNYQYPASAVESGCVARCQCPLDAPLVVHGACRPASDCRQLDIGPCFVRRAVALYSDPPVEYVPSCDNEDTFSSLQCAGNNVCWCTDPQGAAQCPLFDGRGLPDDVCTGNPDSLTEKRIPLRDYPIDSPCVLRSERRQSGNTCAIWGNGRVRQFDSSSFQVKMDCYYGLLNDISPDGTYHVYARFTECGDVFCVATLQFFVKRTHQFLVTSDYFLYHNGTQQPIQNQEHPAILLDGLVRIRREGNAVIVTLPGLEITYSKHYLILFLEHDYKSDAVGACGRIHTGKTINTRYSMSLIGFSLFEKWKLIPYCDEAERVIEFPMELSPGEASVLSDEVSLCNQIQDLDFDTNLKTKVSTACLADSLGIGEKESFCASIAVLFALHTDNEMPQFATDICG